MHPFLGAAFAGGGGAVALAGAPAAGFALAGASLPAGLLVDHLCFAVDLTPVTASMLPGGVALFEANATAGAFIPLRRRLLWPLRFGVGGGFAVNGSNPIGAVELRRA